MYELRILSGLHRGATLPLHEARLTIGASGEADVVLVDPGIEKQHATLSARGNAWSLSAGDGLLFDAATNRAQSLIDLLPGEYARVGEVWITIMLEDAAWTGAPPVPQDAAADDALFVATGAGDEADAAGPAGHAAPEPGIGAGPLVMRKRRGARIAAALLATTVVLSTAAAYAMMSSAGVAASATRPVAREPLPGLHDMAGHKTGPSAPASHDGMGAVDVAMAPEQLRKAFRKRLADADLLDQFDLTLDDDGWHMKGALEDEDARRFDHLLRAFISEHGIAFPVQAKIVSHEGMLPFKIRQVVSGASPNIVTEDGQRLFIGGELNGMRLVAVQDNHLTFAGKRKIELNW